MVSASRTVCWPTRASEGEEGKGRAGGGRPARALRASWTSAVKYTQSPRWPQTHVELKMGLIATDWRREQRVWLTSMEG